jgi:hypothetical protein
MAGARERSADREDPARLLRIQLDRVRALREARVAEGETDALLPALRRWQAQRLARTYADLAASARYAPATAFFLSDLYGERDHTERDLSLERAYPMLVKVLPAAVLVPVAGAIELHALTGELDRALSKALLSDRGAAKGGITEASYAGAYRRCANRPQRLRQIELLIGIGARLDRVVGKPLLQRMLRLARRPARAGGFAELQDFLERGFSAFKHMQGAGEFLATVGQRETAILERLFAGAPHPFDPLPGAA